TPRICELLSSRPSTTVNKALLRSDVGTLSTAAGNRKRMNHHRDRNPEAATSGPDRAQLPNGTSLLPLSISEATPITNKEFLFLYERAYNILRFRSTGVDEGSGLYGSPRRSKSTGGAGFHYHFSGGQTCRTSVS